MSCHTVVKLFILPQHDANMSFQFYEACNSHLLNSVIKLVILLTFIDFDIYFQKISIPLFVSQLCSLCDNYPDSKESFNNS